MAIERYELIREPKRSSGGGVFWVVIVLMITLMGLIAFNGGLRSPSHFALNAAKA